MILRQFYLYPDMLKYSDTTRSTFDFQTRSLCNYLERKIKPLKFKTTGFKRICIILSNYPSANCEVNSSNVLSVEVYFDINQYKTLNKEGLNDFFVPLLIKGLQKCKQEYDIPLKEILQYIEDFRNINYLNQWVYKKCQFKNYNIKCQLVCKLTIDYFHLVLEIEKFKKQIFKKEILKTLPDEIIFSHQFQDIKEENNHLIIFDRNGGTLYKLDLDKLLTV